MATHPKLLAAAKKAIDDYGVGTAAVRTIIGTMDIHEELEKQQALLQQIYKVRIYFDELE